jgi:sortase A
MMIGGTHLSRLVTSRTLHLAERVLLVLAVVMLGWYGAVQTMAAFAQASWARELEGMAGRVDVASESRSPSPLPAPLAPDALVGRVELPRVGVSAIVREGVDDGTLRRAVGHIPRTAFPGAPGNAAFAGHRDTFFRGLRDVRIGDLVKVTTPSNVFRYVVQETRVVTPQDVWVLSPTTQPTLTLVTCYPFSFLGAAPERFVVRATLE